MSGVAMTTAINSSRYCHCEESRDARDDAAISILNLCNIKKLKSNLDKRDKYGYPLKVVFTRKNDDVIVISAFPFIRRQGA